MNILIAGGGTGGHIFPAFSLARALKKIDPGLKIVFVSSDRKLELELFQKNKCDYRTLKLITPPSGLSFRILLFLSQFIKAFFASNRLVKELKPKAVVGFGSYISLAVILAAKFNRIPVIIHEQNVWPGRANRFLALFANKIAVSFKESYNYIGQKEKLVLTGNPVRFSFSNQNKKEALEHFKLSPNKFTILLMGGSQGAHFLNQLLAELTGILNKEDKDNLQFIHLSGADDFGLVKESYQSAQMNAAVFSFLDEMDLAYLASDLIVGRAGATAIAEICNLGRPSILVPYPYAGAHQKCNALVLQNKGAALVLEQKNLTAEILRNNIISLTADKKRLELMAANSRILSFPQAGENLAGEVINLC